MAIQIKITQDTLAVMPQVTTTTVGYQNYMAAYGPNYFVLEGITTEPKYALQIWNAGLTELIADLRQPADPNNEAAFDIGPILQSYVAPPDGLTSQSGGFYNVEWTGYYGDPYQRAFNEQFGYKIKFGYEDSNGAFVQVDGTQGPYTVLGGAYMVDYLGDTASQPLDVPGFVYDTYYPNSAYITALRSCDPAGCTSIDISAAAQKYANYSLTDSRNKLKWDESLNLKPLPGGVPAAWEANKWIWCHKTTRNSFQTISFLNKVNQSGASEPCEIATTQIAAVRIQSYNGETKVDDVIIPNVTGEGGGPNSSIGGPLMPDGDYTALYFGAGGRNLVNYLSTGPLTHYYISTLINQNTGSCTAVEGWPNLYPNPTEVWRFDFIEETCLDFTPITLSWLNTRGFMDYFIFNKRSDFKTTVKRESYYSDTDPLTNTSYNNWRPNSRGITTFSSQIQDEWTLTTDWLTDLEAMSLRSLFISPMVKMDVEGAGNGLWIAVQVQDAQWEEKTYRKDRLFQYKITLKRAKNQNQNRG